MHFPFQGSHSKLSPLERKDIYSRLCSNYNHLLNLFICSEHNSFIQETFTALQGTGAIMMKRQTWFLLSWDSQYNRTYKYQDNQSTGPRVLQEHTGGAPGSSGRQRGGNDIYGKVVLRVSHRKHRLGSRRRTGTRYWNRVTPPGCGLQVCSSRTL